MKPLRVLVAEDSALARAIVADALKSSMHIGEVEFATDGLEAVKKVEEFDPDIVLLDVFMPVMDGLASLKEMLKKRPVRVILFSALTDRDSSIVLEALELGALDFIPKPKKLTHLGNLREFQQELVSKVLSLSQIPLEKITFQQQMRRAAPSPLQTTARRVPPKVAVVIAASTGGPSAVASVLRGLPSMLPAAIFIVQHMPKVFTTRYARRLGAVSALPVKEAEDDELVYEGHGYIAPGDFHMSVVRQGGVVRIKVFSGPKIHFVRPSADPTMISAAKAFRDKTVAVVLTGMGDDGSEGVKAVKRAGGYVIAQDKSTSIIFAMPEAAIKTGCVDEVLSLHDIPRRIAEVVFKKFKEVAG